MVKTSVGGKVIMVHDMTDSTKISDVKAKVQAQTGIAATQQRLIFGGKEQVDTDDLKKCGIKAKSTLVMAVKTVGGSKINSDTLLKDTGLRMTTESDFLGMTTNEPCVRMPCGHAWAPSSLTAHIGKYLNRPERPTVLKCSCGYAWDYVIFRQAAMLTDAECEKIEEKQSLNYCGEKLKTFTCPHCYLICTPPENDNKNPRVRCQGKNCPIEFCAICLNKWESFGSSSTICKSCTTDPTYCNDVLKNSPLKNIGDRILNVPKWRCCPRLSEHKFPVLIEHDINCKHIPCFVCNKKFCFVCLQLQNDNESWPESCKGAYDMCTKAPPQSF